MRYQSKYTPFKRFSTLCHPVSSVSHVVSAILLRRVCTLLYLILLHKFTDLICSFCIRVQSHYDKTREKTRLICQPMGTENWEVLQVRPVLSVRVENFHPEEVPIIIQDKNSINVQSFTDELWFPSNCHIAHPVFFLFFALISWKVHPRAAAIYGPFLIQNRNDEHTRLIWESTSIPFKANAMDYTHQLLSLLFEGEGTPYIQWLRQSQL